MYTEILELSAIAVRIDSHPNVYRNIYKIPTGASTIEITAGRTPYSSLRDNDGNELRGLDSRNVAVQPGEEWIVFELTQDYFEVRAI